MNSSNGCPACKSILARFVRAESASLLRHIALTLSSLAGRYSTEKASTCASDGDALIYAAFTLWLLLIVFLGLGVHRLLSQMFRPAWINWALLPGTVVSEVAYIFGCLITGGEIRRARIMPTSPDSKSAGDAEPITESAAKLKVIGPVVAALVAMVACAGGILAASSLLGEPVMDEFSAAGGSLAKSLPTSWDLLWVQIDRQVGLLRHTCDALSRLDWLDWRVPLFAYLGVCLSVRLAPVRRDLRATLAAAVVIAGVIAIVGRFSNRFGDLMRDIWPLLAYVYATLLLLLIAALLVRGVVLLLGVLTGRRSGTA